jgi:hypothetical protein
MKPLSAPLPTAPNISILNALITTLAKTISNILTPTPYILGVLCIIVTSVESVEIQCQSCSAFAVQKLCISGAWTNKKCWSYQRSNLFVITILRIRKN